MMMTNTKNQTTTMTLYLEYTPFKFYYLVKKDQTNWTGVGVSLPERTMRV